MGVMHRRWIQRKKSKDATPDSAAAIPQAGGAPLGNEIRARMEPQLGASLSDVRVHTGAESKQAASSFGARAFTVGSDVHFASGEFAPGSKEGDRLLAHELTHVVQGQKSGIQRKSEPGHGDAEHGADEGQHLSEPNEPAEKEADAVADHVADNLHDGKKKPAGKGNGKHGDASGEHAADGEPASANGAASDSAAKEKAPQIGAKFVGVGRKIFRSTTGATTSNATSTAAANPGTKLRKKIEKERDDMSSAANLTALGGKIATTAKPGDAPVKLSNTVNSAERARQYFDAQNSPAARAKKQAFVESRMAPALQDQKAGIRNAQEAMLAKPDPQIADVDYGRAQGAAVFGANKGVVLAPENLDDKDAEASKDKVKAKKGLAKVVGLSTFWKNMDDKLRQLWVRSCGNDEKKAQQEWMRQARAAERPVTKPANMGSVKPTEFAAYADPASAFTGTLVGAMGLVQEYDDIKSFKDAFDKLGLNPDWYDGGFAFLVTIPSNDIDKATGAGGGPKLNIGKPSLYSSLAFAEFNYIVEDRATNTTAMNDTSNSGVVDPKGKTEVTVNNISYSELFSQPVRVLK